MSYLMSQFISLNLNSSKSIVAANGDSMPLACIGSVDTPFVASSDVYYISGLTINLTSVSKICDSGYDVNFSVSDCCIYDQKTQEVVGKGHSNSISSSTAPFDLVHYDVWGPAPVSTKRGFRYYVSFIDDFTRYTWVYLMKRRFDFLTVFKEFRALVKTQHSTISCTDTPQQNGVAERKHRHLVETVRSFLLSTDVPSVFWVEAVLTTTYVINIIPTAHNSGLSPFEKLYETSPDYSTLRIDPFEEHTPIVSPIKEPASEATSETTTTTETPPVIIFEATPTVTQPPLTTTQSSSEVAAVPPANVRSARICYAQEYGMDYEETCAPVAKMTTVRTLIAVASSRKWKIYQLDVKNAFLNYDLNEECETSLENRVMKEWYVVKGSWLEGLINLGVDLCHQQVVPSLERDEVEVEFGCHLEVRVEIEHEAH
ncbi:gag-pol polyprotein [Tanacetum coccineum]